jgi:pyridoxine 4-dehydrogenase
MSHGSHTSPRPGGTYRLGNRDVSRIGYGAMQIEHLRSDPAAAVALLERAIELGVDHIDTAEFYGNGFVNEVVRKAASSRPDVVISTKVGAEPNPGGKVRLKLAQRPEELRASVEKNLMSLGLEHIPLVNLRRADVPPGLAPEGDQIVDLDDQLAAMIALRDEGKIGAIGLSAVDLQGLRRAVAAGIACVQNAYSLVSRQFEEMLAFCRDNGIAWVPFFPLGSAFPGWPKVVEHPKAIEIAARSHATPSQVGLAWLLAHSPNTLLIPGTANRDHLEQNMAVASIALDAIAMSELDAIANTPSPAPGASEPRASRGQ